MLQESNNKGYFWGFIGAILFASAVLATPPVNDKLFNLIFRGIGQTETSPETDSVGTTPEAAFDTDLIAAQRNDSYTQEVLIRNSSSDFGGTARVECVGDVAWSGVSSCQTLCAASTLTCSGASTDGKIVPAATELNRTYDGTNCICIVASGASGGYQAERVIR
jgi:hypothetical protein